MVDRRRPTYTIQPELFRITIKGIPLGKLQVPDDQGIIGNLLGLISDQKMPQPLFIENTGPGMLTALFYMDDSDKVIKWLEERADEVVEHPK